MGAFGMGLDFGSLLGGAMSLGGQIYSTDRSIEAAKAQQEREQAFNAEQAQLNRDWQTSEREQQNQWNLDQWNRANEYNSLASQIERALAAGVNPNAVIGNGAGVASSPAQGSSIGSGAQASTPSIAGELMEVISGAPSRFASSINDMANAVGTSIDNKTRDAMNRKRLKVMSANLDNLVKDGIIKDNEAKIIEKNFSWIDRINYATLTKIYNEASELASREVLNYQKSRVADKQVDETVAHTTLMEEQAATEREKQKVLEQQAIKETFLNDFRKNTGLDPNTTILPAAIQLAKLRTGKDDAKITDGELLEACAIMCSPQLVQGIADVFGWFGKFLNRMTYRKDRNFPQPNYVVIQ